MEVIIENTGSVNIEFNANIAGKKPQDQVQSDWNESNQESKAFINNKPDVIISEPIDDVTEILKDL